MKYKPEIKTIKKIEFNEKYIQLTFEESDFQDKIELENQMKKNDINNKEIEENNKKWERYKWHWSCKYNDIYNKIKNYSRLSKRIHNKGFKGLKMAFYYNEESKYWEFLCFVME